MDRVTRMRAVAMLVIFSLILTLFASRLYYMQIIATDGNTDNTDTYTTLTTVRAARGDILDRNGNLLVGNRASYNLVFNHYVIKSYPNTNEEIKKLIEKCEELEVTYLDHFPVTADRPFEYTFEKFPSSWQTYFQSYMLDRDLDSDVTAPLLVENLRERYKIPNDWDDAMARAVIGIRYEFDLRGVTNLPTYTFLEDVPETTLSAILELNTPGLMVEASTVREYHTTYAAHLLGYTGKMDGSDWKIYKDQNYSMDAHIGQAGMEEAFEEYLHGIDGLRVDVASRDGTIIRQYYLNDPIPGSHVETTIDINLQMAAEEALAEVMSQITDPSINTKTGKNTGLDAEGAAVVVMDVKTGEILACASYPTYNPATLQEDWNDIITNELKPLFNRAFGAAYAPGSTFKPLTTVAAMENVYINAEQAGLPILAYGEMIRDMGVFTEYGPGFNPKCSLYNNVRGATHGEIDASDALKLSCNYFFYILGSRMTWQVVDETAKAFGLGEPTGIELTEETGARNNPDTKAAVYGSGINASFSAGDRVLGAIGQGEHRFTPLQLCVYASTLANKGVRYEATFIRRVVSFDYRSLIMDNEPSIASQMEISWNTWNTYYSGMRKVITEQGGTADAYFGGPDDSPVDHDGVWPLKDKVIVYAKTGTAEHSSGGSDHGAFICFAHSADKNEPEVAVAVFGEKVSAGSKMAPVAEKVLEAYFNFYGDYSTDVIAFENQLS